MDEIKKYSKEWFVTYASKEVKNAAKNLKEGFENGIQGSFSTGIFDGTKEEVEGWFGCSPKMEAMKDIINQYGGVDNLFELIDTNKDGILTSDEASGIAAVNTPDDAERLDKKFNTKDLEIIYQNIMAVDEAEVSETDKTKTFKFKDGSKTEVEYDETGKVVKSSTEKINEKGERFKTTYDANGKVLEVSSADGKKQDVSVDENNLKVKNTTDAQGRVIKTEITGSKKSEEKLVETEYHKDGSKTVKTETVGRIVVEEYDKNNRLIKKQEEFNYNAPIGPLDGVIEETNQGNVGDCWLLAGVNALAQTEAGAKAIKDAIVKNNDGTVSITLKGADRTYTYTPEQIMSLEYARDISATATGDYDMNLIEMAVSDYRREQLSQTEDKRPRTLRGASMKDPLNAGTGEESMFLLTGKHGVTSADENKLRRDIDNFAKNPQKYGMVVAFREADPEIYSKEAAEVSFSRSEVVDIIAGHAYTVSRVDNDNVYVRDPKDSYWEIAYPKNKFFANVISSSVTDLQS